MEYVVIEISGKQYRVSQGHIIEVDNLNKEIGSISFDKVLLSVNGEDIKIGKPYIDGVSVNAKLIENLRGNKIRVARFTAKSRHRRVVGFRAALSKVQIEKIVIGKSPVSSSPKVKSSVQKTPTKK